MQVYELHFYRCEKNEDGTSRQYESIGSALTNEIIYEYDYVSISDSNISLYQINSQSQIEKNDICVFKIDDEAVIAIVKNIVKQKENWILTIAPFISYYDSDNSRIVKDPTSSLYENVSLEEYFQNIIVQNTGVPTANPDIDTPEINCLTYSTTEDWYLGETYSTSENISYQSVNPYRDLFIPAFKRYSIVISFGFSEEDKILYAYIEAANDDETFNIEADLPSIINSSYDISDETPVNTVYIQSKYIYNNGNSVWEGFGVYYRSNDGEWSRDISTRALPVNYKATTVEIDFGSASGVDWDEALSRHIAILGGYSSSALGNIEIEVPNNYERLNLYNFGINRACNVIHNGNVYSTVFTGYKRNESTTTFTFGMARLKLTKLIQRR